MYLNVKVKESSRDYLRVLWKEPGEKGPPRVYRFTTLIFGQSDAPFQAQYILQKHATSFLKPGVPKDLQDAATTIQETSTSMICP